MSWAEEAVLESKIDNKIPVIFDSDDTNVKKIKFRSVYDGEEAPYIYMINDQVAPPSSSGGAYRSKSRLNYVKKKSKKIVPVANDYGYNFFEDIDKFSYGPSPYRYNKVRLMYNDKLITVTKYYIRSSDNDILHFYNGADDLIASGSASSINKHSFNGKFLAAKNTSDTAIQVKVINIAGTSPSTTAISSGYFGLSNYMNYVRNINVQTTTGDFYMSLTTSNRTGTSSSYTYTKCYKLFKINDNDGTYSVTYVRDMARNSGTIINAYKPLGWDVDAYTDTDPGTNGNIFYQSSNGGADTKFSSRAVLYDDQYIMYITGSGQLIKYDIINDTYSIIAVYYSTLKGISYTKNDIRCTGIEIYEDNLYVFQVSGHFSINHLFDTKIIGYSINMLTGDVDLIVFSDGEDKDFHTEMTSLLTTDNIYITDTPIPVSLSSMEIITE